jgi:HSP20 family protein
MAIIRWKPWWLDEPFEDMERFFKEEFPAMLPQRVGGFVPSVDVYETKDSVIVESPLAGVDPKDVDIFIEDNILTIKGETKKKTEVDEKNYYRKEVRYGNFYRRVSLPAAVAGEKAKAVSENGVLKISIPKLPGEKKEKAIKIKIAAKK